MSLPLTTENAEVFAIVTDGKVWMKTLDPDPHDIVNSGNVDPDDATPA